MHRVDFASFLLFVTSCAFSWRPRADGASNDTIPERAASFTLARFAGFISSSATAQPTMKVVMRRNARSDFDADSHLAIGKRRPLFLPGASLRYRQQRGRFLLLDGVARFFRPAALFSGVAADTTPISRRHMPAPQGQHHPRSFTCRPERPRRDAAPGAPPDRAHFSGRRRLARRAKMKSPPKAMRHFWLPPAKHASHVTSGQRLHSPHAHMKSADDADRWP